MAITPDPGGEFLKAFSVADTSNRDYQRIEMQRQAMAEAAVQRARENKANDFKLMLDALRRQDDLAQRQVQNQQQDFQNQTARYNAQTSRYNTQLSRTNAMRPRSTYGASYGDPLGLAGGSTTPASSSTPDAALPDVPPIPGGEPPLPTGDNFAGPDASVLGGDNPDPPTPLNPAYGAVSAEDRGILPDAPVTDPLLPPPVLSAPLITEAAPEVAAAPPDLSSEPVVAPPTAPVDNTPPPAMVESAGPPAPAPEMPTVPQTLPTVAPASDSGSLLPPPVLTPPAIGGVDLVSPLRNEMFQLQKASQEMARSETQRAQEANKILSALPRVAPELRPVYLQKLEEVNQASVAASGQAQEAKIRAEQLARQTDAVQKRQDALGALTGLEGVLPPNEQAQLIKEAADPTTGGQTDRKILTLAQYDAVRQQYGLTHQSRGFKTAQDVARVGQALATKDALEDRRAAQQAITFKQLIAENKTLPPDQQADPDTVKEWQKQVNANAAGERLWKEREMMLKRAVEADTVPPPPTIEPPSADMSVAKDAGAAAPAVPAASASPAGLGFLQTPESVQAQERQREANRFWTEGKQQAAKLGRISEMSDAEVAAIAEAKAPIAMDQQGGYETEPYYKTMAAGFADKFKMPAGADNPATRGRSREVTPAEFLREAAKEELARRRMGVKAVKDPEQAAKLEAAVKVLGF